MEYIFNILPCKLCVLQRYPYYFIFVVIAAYYLLKLTKYEKYVIILIILAFFTTASIAFYHSLVEFEIIENALNCSDISNFDNLEELSAYLKNKPAVSCDIQNFKIILSLQNWNGIIAFLLGFLGIYAIINKKKFTNE